MKGIVSFDMDMTLLNHADYKIPDSAIKALDLLRKNYYIVIATGRDMDAKFSEGLADEVKPDAIIHLNGNKITIGSELIYEHCMKRELVEELLHFAEGKDYAIGMTVADVGPEVSRPVEASGHAGAHAGLHWPGAWSERSGGGIPYAEASTVFQPGRGRYH